MGQTLLVLLILAHTFLTIASASSGIEPKVVEPPAFSPLDNINIQTAEPPRSRKFVKHHVTKSEPPATVSSSSGEENGENTTDESWIYLEKQHHHGLESRSVDKSIVGGGVILGGLVMVFVVSVLCYIRATRRRSMEEPPTPTTERSV